MSKKAVLVIEDDEDIQELLKYNLNKEGYRLIQVMNGEEGLVAARREQPDIIILDLMLPGMDGLEVCRHLKRDDRTEMIPVVILTAKGEETDVVTGLELGAEDYITKPFSPRVLIARMRAVWRRRFFQENEAESGKIKMYGLVIDPGRHEVSIKGRKLNLTVSEYRLLYFLASRPGWVFTRCQIVDAIRGDDYPVTERSVDVQIVGLRKKLGSCGIY